MVIDPAQDAFGVALVDYLEGRHVPELTLEGKDGWSRPAMHPEWFFRGFEDWDWREREILPVIESGPVLDLGAGAGRAALYFQQRGLPVTAVDASPGAVEVCRRRGVADVRLGDVNDPPRDRSWAAVLLLCGNPVPDAARARGASRECPKLTGRLRRRAAAEGFTMSSAAEDSRLLTALAAAGPAASSSNPAPHPLRLSQSAGVTQMGLPSGSVITKARP
jgi:SAM-dependent methyltransferase